MQFDGMRHMRQVCRPLRMQGKGRKEIQVVTMLFVKAIVAPSTIHGLGLFADEPIANGTVVSCWTAEWDRVYSQDLLAEYPPTAVGFIEHFGWLKNGLWYVSLDNSRFINHSNTPNTRDGVAIHDIPAGAEITEDYSYCEAWRTDASGRWEPKQQE